VPARAWAPGRDARVGQGRAGYDRGDDLPGFVQTGLQQRIRSMTRYLPGIFAMALIVVISNILVQFLYGDWLTWGAFTYPFAFW